MELHLEQRSGVWDKVRQRNDKAHAAGQAYSQSTNGDLHQRNDWSLRPEILRQEKQLDI